MATFQYKNETIHYTNEGEGPALVLIHGLGGNANNWLYQRKHFKKKYQVITIDLPGHGRSQGLDTIPFEEYHQVVYQLVTEELGLPSAFLCGISMGGKVTMNVAYHYPQMAKAIVLADTFAKMDEETVKNRKEIFELLDEEDGVNKWIARVIEEMGIAPESRIAKSFHMGMKQNDISFIKKLFSFSQKQDQRPILSAITAPTLILHGERDRFTPLAASQELERGIKEAQFFSVPNSGHIPHVEQPEIFNEQVETFLQQHQG